MVVADQIVDSSITNNNSNNNREVDDDFKRVNEVLETLKARVFQPTFFSIKNFPAPQNVHPKRSASKRLLVEQKRALFFSFGPGKCLNLSTRKNGNLGRNR